MLLRLRRRLASSTLRSSLRRAWLGPSACVGSGAVQEVPVTSSRLAWPFRLINSTRGLYTKTEISDVVNEDHKDPKPQKDDSKSPPSNIEAISSTEYSNVRFGDFSNLRTSSRHDLAMIFTCKVCETRSMKTICKESYEKGVVVVRCGGCSNLHLIADRLGWFGEPGSIEDLLSARGEDVKKGSVDTLNLTLEDLAGSKLP